MAGSRQAGGMLQGRVAIVTGAGKGLGRAWALHLAALGAAVVVNNRGAPGRGSADEVVGEIRRAGGSAVADCHSVEATEAGQRLVEAALGEFGRLDIVVANAGVDRAGSFHKRSLAEFEEVFSINFMGTARLLHAAWPVLREGGYGRVLVSSSTAGLFGNHGQAAYAASKAALHGLLKTLALEGASRGVLVNAIAPYAVTQLTAAAFPGDQALAFVPEATAPLVGWLVSEDCSLTGQTFIAGAGGARRTVTMESDTVVLGSDPAAALSTLMESNCTREPPSAIAEFEDFRQSV